MTKHDPKYIDKRSPYTKRMEQAGRDYTARIAHAEDVFFAGADTQARRDAFGAAMEKALVMLHESEAEIRAQYGEAIPARNESEAA